jgi:hypothetical protein
MTPAGTARGRIVIHPEDPKVIGGSRSADEGRAQRASHSRRSGRRGRRGHYPIHGRPGARRDTPACGVAVGFLCAGREDVHPSQRIGDARDVGDPCVPRDRSRSGDAGSFGRRRAVAVSCHVATAPLPPRPTVRSSIVGRTLGAGPMPERVSHLGTTAISVAQVDHDVAAGRAPMARPRGSVCGRQVDQLKAAAEAEGEISHEDRGCWRIVMPRSGELPPPPP